MYVTFLQLKICRISKHDKYEKNISIKIVLLILYNMVKHKNNFSICHKILT